MLTYFYSIEPGFRGEPEKTDRPQEIREVIQFKGRSFGSITT